MSSFQKLSKQTRLLSFLNNRFILFLTGCALGAACFLWVYGVRILDPVYDAWLFNTDMDLKQHYIGWCHYRMSDWHFPVGLIDTLSYPTSVSVIFTDSIPLLALFFKLFGGVLPIHFQYFGLFGFVSFMLMGGISSLVVMSLLRGGACRDEETPSVTPGVIALISSPVYILSTTVLQRMFYHTALGAQWIILLALYIWFNRHGYSRRRILVSYGLMGLLCVGIHTYYVPMVGSILLAAGIENCVAQTRREKQAGCEEGVSRGKYLWPHLFWEAVNLFAFCFTGLLTLYVFGAFYGESGGVDEGFGSFVINLNTFINPLYGSVILKPMKLYYAWQYEGYAYLGLGVLILAAFGMVYMVKSLKKAGIKKYLKEHIRFSAALAVILADTVLALIPIVTFGGVKLFGIPLPGIVRNAMGIFRSNGRFIWVPMYLITTGALCYAYRQLSEMFGQREKGGKIIIKAMVFLVLLQVLDATPVIKTKQNYFTKEQYNTSIWTKVSFPASDLKYREMVFLYNENDIMMDTAFFAYLNGRSINNYYYARDIDAAVNANILQWKEELKAGKIRDDVIYICRKRDYDEEYAPLATAGKMHWYELDKDHMAGVR